MGIQKLVKKTGLVMGIVTHAITWVLWCERSIRVCDEVALSIDKLILEIKFLCGLGASVNQL